MKKNIFGFLLVLCIIFMVGCNKEITVKDLRNIKIEIEDKLADGGDYDNFSSCVVDEKSMKVVVELIDNSASKQEEFRNNVYDSKYLVFKEAGPYENDDEEGISMEVKEETVSSKSAVVTIKNGLNMDYYYGNEYYVEVLNGDEFERIDYLEGKTPSWNSNLNTLKAQSQSDINLNWASFYGSLPNGNYQIVKEICADMGCNKKDTIYAEFAIE